MNKKSTEMVGIMCSLTFMFSLLPEWIYPFNRSFESLILPDIQSGCLHIFSKGEIYDILLKVAKKNFAIPLEIDFAEIDNIVIHYDFDSILFSD
jgi:hypothetical protein